jgi:RHS repeat-associated protein
MVNARIFATCRRSRLIAVASLLWVLTSGARLQLAQTGTVAVCQGPFGSGAIITVSGAGPSYIPPLEVGVSASGINPQSLQAQTNGFTIVITVTGTSITPARGACGNVRLDQLPAVTATYTIDLYVARDNQPGELRARRVVDVIGGPRVDPPPPPPLTGSLGPYALTQPVGEIGFQRSVSLDGAAQISIPLWVPPGRLGVQPSLALKYSSRAGNGPLGVGWSLSGVSAITACRRTPSADGAYGGRYPDRLCLDGQRLVEISRRLPLPIFNSAAQYNTGAQVQFNGNAYEALSVFSPPQATDPTDATRWKPLGLSTASIEYRTEVDTDRKVVGKWKKRDQTDFSPYPDWLDVFEPDGTILRFGDRIALTPHVQGPVYECLWGKPIFQQMSIGGIPIQGPLERISDEHGGCTPAGIQGRVWMLSEVKDRFDNRMEIDYERGEAMLPAEVRYTYHANAPYTKSVKFAYENRPDTRNVTLNGVLYTFARRLKTIDVSAPSGLSDTPTGQTGVLRRYSLAYDIHPVTKQSILTRLTECVSDDSKAPCLAPLTFAYSMMGGFSFVDLELAASAATGVNTLPLLNGFRVADLDGDGFDDVLYRKSGALTWAYRLSTGTALGAELTTGIFGVPDDGRLADSFVNFDRDQAVDALVPAGGGNYAIFRGNTTGPFQVSAVTNGLFTAPIGPFPSGMSGFGSRVVAVGDLNGDMRPDLIVSHACRLVQKLSDMSGVGNYVACRWGVALNQTMPNGPIDFTSAIDVKTDATPCADQQGLMTNNPRPGYTSCIEVEQNNPAFVVDTDGNGVNEVLAPIRRLTTDTVPKSWREPDHALELRSLSLPLHSPSAVRRTGLPSKRIPRVFLDMNGDGLADEVSLDGGVLRASMNLGGTFNAPVDAPVSAAAIAALSRPNEMRVGDMNNDGLEDIYLVGARILLQSNGRLGFDEISLASQIPEGEDSCGATPCPDFISFVRRRWDQLLDFNGDGLTDVLQMRGGKAYVLVRSGVAPALLEKVSGGSLTPEVYFQYQSTPKIHTAGQCTFPQYCLRKGMWFVSEMAEKANVRDTAYPSGFNRMTYSYSGGRFDVQGRGWLGVSERKVKDEQTGAVLVTEMDNTSVAGPLLGGPYRYPGAFRPRRETTQADSRTPEVNVGVLRKVTVEYDYADRVSVTTVAGPTSASIVLRGRSALKEVRRTVAEASVQRNSMSTPVFVPLASSRRLFDTNDYGLVTYELRQTFEGGFDANNEVPATAKIKALQIDRTPSAVDTQDWLVRRVDREVVTSVEPARDAVVAAGSEPARPGSLLQLVRRTTDFHWKPGTTSVDRITVEPTQTADTSLYSVTELEYETTGNLKRMSTTADSGDGVVTRITRFEWDPLDQTLISKVTNPLQQSEQTVYYAGLGMAQSREDFNGLRVLTALDRLGRVRRVTYPSRNYTEVSYELPLNRPGVLLVATKEAGGTLNRRYSDAWGSVVREEESRLHGRLAGVDRTFTRLGQLETQTLPAFDDDPAPERYVSSYDNLGRIVVRTIGRADPKPPLGTPIVIRDPSQDIERWSYDRLTTRYENARGTASTTTVDGAGRVVRSAIIDPQSGDEIVTHLDYRPFGLLEAITDPKGNRTVFDYDARGRNVSVTDPSSRQTTAGVNGFGEVVLSSSTAGQSVTIVRDLLGRSTEERYALSGTTRIAKNVWDTASHGIGRLAEATSTDKVRSVYSYDAFSRPTLVHWEVPGPNTVTSTFDLGTDWDAFDRPSILTYPAVGTRQLAVRYYYEPEGSLYKIGNAATGDEYWSLREEDATGAAVTEVFAGDTTTSRFLDARKRLKYLETHKRITAPQARDLQLQQIAYDYGKGNLIRSRHDVGPDATTRATEDFGYDYLGRLTSWSVYQNCRRSIQEYGYDTLGNLKSISVLEGDGRTATIEYGPSVTSPNAPPCAPRELTEGGRSVEFQYDLDGRRTSGGGTTIDWNEFDRPQNISAGPLSVSYSYDSSHRRTTKRVSNAGANPLETTYIGGLYERHITPASRLHVFNLLGAAGVLGQITLDESSTGAIVEQQSSFHPDVLGSPDAVSGQSAGSQRTKYEPFGQRRYPWALATPASVDSTSSVGFTGHEPDDEFGFINMKGRIYDPRTMRFLTPDPIIGSVSDVRALNRYAYVANNPVNFTDPSGFDCGPLCIDSSPPPPPSDGGSLGGKWGEEPLCGYGNPYNCTTPNPEPNVYGTPAATQTSTKADFTRTGADAGVALTPDMVVNENMDPIDLNDYLGDWGPGGHSDLARNAVAAAATINSLENNPVFKGFANLLSKISLGTGGAGIVTMNAKPFVPPTAARAIAPPQASASPKPDLDSIVQMLVVIGHQLSGGQATVTSQLAEDKEGDLTIFGVVTGKNGDELAELIRNEALDLLEEFGLDVEVEFERGGRGATVHSERLHRVIRQWEGYLGIGPTYTNRKACSEQCRAAQQAIDAIIFVIESFK